jgi:hypothetical protein
MTLPLKFPLIENAKNLRSYMPLPIRECKGKREQAAFKEFGRSWLEIFSNIHQ